MSAKKDVFTLAAALAVAMALGGCGGGSGGGNDPVTLSSYSTGSTDKDVTVKAGDNFSFTVIAESPDNALSKLSWTMQTSGNAPALAVNNLDCATAEKVDTPRQNNLVSSVWKCTINGSTPKLVDTDATYSFTASATNTKSNSASASSVLKVLATPSDSRTPKVEIDAPTKVAGGEVADLTCNAAGGFVNAGHEPSFSYTWSSSTIDGQQVKFDNRRSRQVKATFPKLAGNSTMIVNCQAEDGAGNVGQASAPVEVVPYLPVVTVSGTAGGTSGHTVALQCSVNGDATGKYTYAWSSTPVNGSALSFTPADRDVVSVTLPEVTVPTSLIAVCEVTDEFGVKGQASKVLEVTPVPVPVPAPVPTPPASEASGV